MVEPTPQRLPRACGVSCGDGTRDVGAGGGIKSCVDPSLLFFRLAVPFVHHHQRSHAAATARHPQLTSPLT